MFVSATATCVLAHAPAKLNLFLEVLARRDDGYHEIETLIAAVSWWDTLELAANRRGEITLACRWAGGLAASAKISRRAATGTRAAPPEVSGDSPFGDLPAGVDNIVYRAVVRLRERSATPLGADIRLVKRVPSAAGLGGASSDAAAALIAANFAWRLDWPLERLTDLAAEIGSDVPFFLRGGWAVCRGRGERIEPARGGRLHAVVVRPPVGLGTGDVYRRCRPAMSPRSAAPLAASLAEGNWRAARSKMTNGLEQPAAALTPWIARVTEELARAGCVARQMSGSGSSCFGICTSARQARRIAARLRSRRAGLVQQVGTLPARFGAAASTGRDRNRRGEKLRAS